MFEANLMASDNNDVRAPLEPPRPCLHTPGRPGSRAGTCDARPHPLGATPPRRELSGVPTFDGKIIPTDIAESAWKLIRSKVKKQAFKNYLDDSTRDDLEQEVWLDLLERWPNYDPAKGPAMKFVAMVVNHRIGEIMKRRWDDINAKRLNTPSLYKKVGKKKKRQLYQTITEDTLENTRFTYERRKPWEIAAMQSDVRALVAKLPEDLQEVCEQLMHHSVKQAARNLKMPESTLHDRIKSLRLYFARLQDYMDLKRG